MRTDRLPWEDDSTVYEAKELKPRKPWVTKACWVMCFILIIGGLITPYRIAIVFGVLYILVLLMQKHVAVTSRGLEVFYQMRITTSTMLWTWEEIGSVIREDRNHPELVALHFGREATVKRFFFTREDSNAIMKLARKKNPKAEVRDAQESEMKGYAKSHY